MKVCFIIQIWPLVSESALSQVVYPGSALEASAYRLFLLEGAIASVQIQTDSPASLCTLTAAGVPQEPHSGDSSSLAAVR